MLLCSSSRDRLIRIFDARDGYRMKHTLNDHSSSVTSARFFEHGKKLASCAQDKSLVLRRCEGDAITRGTENSVNEFIF